MFLIQDSKSVIYSEYSVFNISWPRAEIVTVFAIEVNNGIYADPALFVGLTSLPPSCTGGLEIPGAPISWTSKGLSRHVQG